MIGTKFYKPLETEEQLNEYSAAAEWCNNNNAMIVDQGEYYEVVEIPGPTLEEAKEAKIEYKASLDKSAEPKTAFSASSLKGRSLNNFLVAILFLPFCF